MSKKLAVVISGAVSLGSYEAGVMYEVLEAIAVHNKDLSEHDDNHIEIDVITGASAGAMTACILAQNLLYDDNTLSKPHENSLYKAWVQKVDIVELLDVDKADQKKSLLNANVVEKIAKELIKDLEPNDPKNKDIFKLQKHPAASSEIQIGVAMSNLNGFNYGIKSLQGESFDYTRFKDQFVCSVRRKETSDKAILQEKMYQEKAWEDFRPTTWAELRDAGISSGAFPFAFPMKSISRVGEGKFSQRDSKNKNNENPDPINEGRYFYTDGGTFENEPLGMAKALINHDQENPEDRYYLLVKPGQRKASKDPFFNQKPNLLTTAIALFGAIFQQAQFQDWIMDDVNSKLLTITSNDDELIGDVFSAFSGFLEEKFRAYDYNIGRENARKQLTIAHEKNLLNFDPNALDKMPPIEWKVDKKKSVIRGGRTLTTWVQVKPELSKLAKQIKDDTGKRNQLDELHRLMHEVDPATRQKICDQLKERLESLVDFINEEYLSKRDIANPIAIDKAINNVKAWFGGASDDQFNIQMTARQVIGQPATKKLLTGVLGFWLDANILKPPHIAKKNLV
jgi:predicted acylesterase/phospholipase RssA